MSSMTPLAGSSMGGRRDRSLASRVLFVRWSYPRCKMSRVFTTGLPKFPTQSLSAGPCRKLHRVTDRSKSSPILISALAVVARRANKPIGGDTSDQDGHPRYQAGDSPNAFQDPPRTGKEPLGDSRRPNPGLAERRVSGGANPLPLLGRAGCTQTHLSNRFEEFDSSIPPLMREHFAPDAALVVADLAVSDARTSCDFFSKVAAAFPHLSYHASDYSPRVLVLDDGLLKVTLSRESQDSGDCVSPIRRSTTRVPTTPCSIRLNHVLRILVRRWLARPLVEQGPFRKVRARDVLLFSVRALNLSREDGRFHLAGA